MRTTLTLDDDLAEALKEVAYREGKSFKQVVNDALRAGLENGRRRPMKRRYRVSPVSLGAVRASFDLDKVLRLAAELEDREIARKLELRK